MVKGRLPRESNPLPNEGAGFVASHDTTGEEDYKRTSPLNPLPVTSIGDSNVKDAEVKAELELIKQGIADNKATNDLILARLDNPINTQLTGSTVEHVVFDGMAINDVGIFPKRTNELISDYDIGFYNTTKTELKLYIQSETSAYNAGGTLLYNGTSFENQVVFDIPSTTSRGFIPFEYIKISGNLNIVLSVSEIPTEGSLSIVLIERK